MSSARVTLNARISPPEAIRHPRRPARLECAGEDCPCARSEAAHPPALMMFNPESGAYEQAWLRCVAVWAEKSVARSPGQICGQPATHQIADVVVCEHHYRRIRTWMNDRDQRDTKNATRTAEAIHSNRVRLDRESAAEQARLKAESAREDTERAKEAARLQVQLDRERILAEERARAEVSVVYFVRRESDGLIKIGTSRGLVPRLTGIKRQHGPLGLLATEGGDHKRETQLHRKFAALRVEGEWFRPELPLLEYVYALMKEHPLEAAPGLPPIVPRREIGSMIWNIKIAPVREQTVKAAAAREAANEKRRLVRQQRKAAAA